MFVSVKKKYNNILQKIPSKHRKFQEIYYLFEFIWVLRKWVCSKILYLLYSPISFLSLTWLSFKTYIQVPFVYIAWWDMPDHQALFVDSNIIWGLHSAILKIRIQLMWNILLLSSKWFDFFWEILLTTDFNNFHWKRVFTIFKNLWLIRWHVILESHAKYYIADIVRGALYSGYCV